MSNYDIGLQPHAGLIAETNVNKLVDGWLARTLQHITDPTLQLECKQYAHDIKSNVHAIGVYGERRIREAEVRRSSYAEQQEASLEKK